MRTSMRWRLRSRLHRGLALTAVAAAAALGGAFYALAGHEATSSFTGCLKTSTGTLSRFAVGDTPMSSCPSGHVAVHLSGGDLTAVNAGSGLTGGGTQGAVTLAVDGSSLTGVNADTLDGQDSTDFLGATAAAGGDLTGNYPNPDIAGGAVGASEIFNGSLGTAGFSTSIPAVRVTHSAAQSTAPGTGVAFDSERYDTASMHDTSTNNSRLTAPVTGIYVITASVLWAPGPAGLRIIDLRKNGSPVIDDDSRLAPSAPQGIAASITTLARLEAGDYVEVVIDGSLDILKNGEASPEFAMTWLAPGP